MRHRKDKNEKQIVQELRDLGIFVLTTSDFGFGFPDLVIPYNGKNFFIEIKFDRTSRLTKAQKKFHKDWKENNGQINVALNTQQVLKIIGYKNARNSAQIDNKIQPIDSTTP